jgi:hypothetical protein
MNTPLIDMKIVEWGLEEVLLAAGTVLGQVSRPVPKDRFELSFWAGNLPVVLKTGYRV